RAGDLAEPQVGKVCPGQTARVLPRDGKRFFPEQNEGGFEDALAVRVDRRVKHGAVQEQQDSAQGLQCFRVELVNQLHPPECRWSGHSGWRGVDKRAICSWSAVTAAQLALNADDFPGLGLEVGKVGPGQPELGGPAPRRSFSGDFGSPKLEVLERW